LLTPQSYSAPTLSERTGRRLREVKRCYLEADGRPSVIRVTPDSMTQVKRKSTIV